MGRKENSITRTERRHPALRIFPSLVSIFRGDKEYPVLHYATDGDRLAFGVHGMRISGDWAFFTLKQAKALYADLPEIIAELEGRNG